ncbi:MAG TPA: S8 family serine peptidase [Candidatus Krumholzibacteria bacterium]|nr:S8 family serine peptidase [Candidatus Krumholzibacteria bacterium]HPD71992.1 S8 family serine peptidase [Candidatus Krumholzibacteria bacterium]HRY41075.1 S8 family serine peptidase [Candidatus Krumholzibacteria bacterium]
MKRFLLACALASVVVPALAQELPAGVAGRLARALADPGGTMRHADGSYAVWVRFTDRAIAADRLAGALAAAEAALPARTLARRAKVARPGERTVDARDLPVAPAYLAAVAATGARLRHESRWLNAASVDADRDQIAAIARLPFVASVDLVARFRRPAPPAEPAEREAARQAAETARAASSEHWTLGYGGSLAGLEQINVPPVHELGVTGQGVVIGLLDSGFRTTHEALAGISVLARHDFVQDDDVVENEPGDGPNQHDHGTRTLSLVAGFRAGRLAGAAFGASVILAKTEDVSHEAPIEEDRWVAGLEWVERLGADVVTSSLGYHDWYEFADLDGNTAVTTIAADLAAGRGLVVVNAAGNERRTSFGHLIAPADGDSVIAVGAVNLAGAVANFSSPGPTFDGRIKPDVVAQGVANHVASAITDDDYATADGTSYSCPLAAGVAALVLARVPQLTPLQVHEALRMTADRADAPDNDYGWGVLDALAAVTYWGASIDHAPLADTEDTVGPYVVAARITGRLPVDPARMFAAWRAGDGAWQSAPLVESSGGRWHALLPGQPGGTEVAYYLEVTDSAGITMRSPAAGAAAPLVFTVGPDETPPAVAHAPLGDQPLAIWPPLVSAIVTDNLGVERVELHFTRNGGAEQGPYPLAGAGDVYARAFPLAAGQVAVGDAISYRVDAWDRAEVPNRTTSGPHAFSVVSTRGVVLVIDDSDAGVRDEKVDERKAVVSAQVGRSSAAEFAQWLVEAGYTVEVIPAGAVTPESFAGFEVVVHSAGNSPAPLASPALREALIGWTAGGGRILVEGGEVGYDVLSFPGYPAFADSVLHAGAWRTDAAGALQVVPAQAGHPLLNLPHALPAAIPLSYGGYGDQDAVDPAAGATVVFAPVVHPASAGVLIHDDNEAPAAGQVVYFAFNVRAIGAETGRQLAENAVAYLLAAEAPPTASIAGTVELPGAGDAAGVVVSCGPGHSVVTGPDGSYLLDSLYGGDYVVTASRPGYATGTAAVSLDEGEQLAGVDFMLVPVAEVHVAAAPHQEIPDNSGPGLTSQIMVDVSGELVDVTVDIELAHTWIGDLVVRLTSPAGTEVTLHNRSGGSMNDIVGTWPTTLSVDGPGTLADYLGEEIHGLWTLLVSDQASNDTGTLHVWGLNFLVPQPPVSPTETLPSATRLVGCVPNPFNPLTEVVFDLARGGPVQLAVYDLRGRLVRRLLDDAVEPGRHRLRWDGRDEGGRETPSGVYVCRFRGDGTTERYKLTLVR